MRCSNSSTLPQGEGGAPENFFEKNAFALLKRHARNTIWAISTQVGAADTGGNPSRRNALCRLTFDGGADRPPDARD
jgi:hypothetical protein